MLSENIDQQARFAILSAVQNKRPLHILSVPIKKGRRRALLDVSKYHTNTLIAQGNIRDYYRLLNSSHTAKNWR